MSRTYRRVPPLLEDVDPEFVELLKRGKFPAPIRDPDWPWHEVGSPRAKRRAKRRAARKRRLEANKAISEQIEDFYL